MCKVEALAVLIAATFVLGLQTANAEPMTKAEQLAYERQIALCNRAAQAVYASTVYLIQYRASVADFIEAMGEWSIPDEDKAEMADAYRWVYERQPTNPVAASKIRVAECMGERWHRAPGEDPVYQYHQEGPY